MLWFREFMVLGNNGVTDTELLNVVGLKIRSRSHGTSPQPEPEKWYH